MEERGQDAEKGTGQHHPALRRGAPSESPPQPTTLPSLCCPGTLGSVPPTSPAVVIPFFFFWLGGWFKTGFLYVTALTVLELSLKKYEFQNRIRFGAKIIWPRSFLWVIYLFWEWSFFPTTWALTTEPSSSDLEGGKRPYPPSQLARHGTDSIRVDDQHD